jgi:signal transduction histidine kinase
LIVHRSDGERAWLSVSTQPLEGPDGARLGVVSTFVDVTLQETATRELEEQRALLRRVTAVPGVLYEHVVRVDDTDAFRYVSARAAEVLGLDPKQMRESAATFWARVHPDDRPRVQGAIMAEASARRADEAGGRPADHQFDEEFRIADAGGRWHWVRAQSQGRAVEGELVCHGVITDTTERHLLADQLRAAQRQELTGVLVSGILHNFNNMLAAIVPNLDRPRQRVTGELQHELSDAYEASASAAELVRHLMLLVRRDEPRAPEPVDLASLVQDVVRMCRRSFDQRIVIDSAVPRDPQLVMGHRSELQQVVLNLCINARDAVEPVAAPRIDVHVVPLGSDTVGLTVRDNGVGMSAEAQRRAGQAFFTTKAPDKGTGLALATALGIVREMNGELTWTSVPREGTVFRLVLPLAAESAPGRRRSVRLLHASTARSCSSSTTSRWSARRCPACSRPSG